MYAGHAAIALAVKGVRPRIPIALLVPVAFAPDWIHWLVALRGEMSQMYSHSLGSVGILSTVTALIYWAGFSQHLATGTSLAVLLPPIGLAATLEYWRHDNVDVRAAVLLAASMFVGAWVGAWFANQMKGPQLRLLFGVFLTGLGVYLVYGAFRRLGWI